MRSKHENNILLFLYIFLVLKHQWKWKFVRREEETPSALQTSHPDAQNKYLSIGHKQSQWIRVHVNVSCWRIVWHSHLSWTRWTMFKWTWSDWLWASTTATANSSSCCINYAINFFVIETKANITCSSNYSSSTEPQQSARKGNT